MAKKNKEKHEASLNLTSMMDIVFLLIIFFLLVTNFVSQELPELEIPKPIKSQSKLLEKERITINLIPQKKDNSLLEHLEISGYEPILAGDEGKLTTMLQAEFDKAKAKGKEFEVDLRASLSLQYSQVTPTMNAITGAGIAQVNMVAHVDPNK